LPSPLPLGDQPPHPLSPECRDTYASLQQLIPSTGARITAVCDEIASSLASRDQLEESGAKVIQLEEQVKTRAESERFLLGRISQLEGLLSSAHQETANAADAAVKAADSSKFDGLTKENTVLSEAVEFLHNQVDDLETELKVLKFNSTVSSASSKLSPLGRTQSLYAAQTTPPVHLDVSTKLALEMAFLAPLVRGLRKEAAHYRSRSMAGDQAFLRPLKLPNLFSDTSPSLLPQPQEGGNEDGNTATAPIDDIRTLRRGRNNCEVAADGLRRSVHAVRMLYAETQVIDLSSSQRRPRELLRKMKMDISRVNVDVEERSAAAVRLLESRRINDHVPLYEVEGHLKGKHLLGKVIIGRTNNGKTEKDEMRVIPLNVTSDDLQSLHNFFLTV